MLMTSPGLQVGVNLLARAHFGYPQTLQAVDGSLNPFGIAEQNHAVGRLAGNRSSVGDKASRGAAGAGNFSDIGFYQVSNLIMFVTTNIIPYLMFIVTNIYVGKIL
jgi:hypothetical protein